VSFSSGIKKLTHPPVVHRSAAHFHSPSISPGGPGCDSGSKTRSRSIAENRNRTLLENPGRRPLNRRSSDVSLTWGLNIEYSANHTKHAQLNAPSPLRIPSTDGVSSSLILRILASVFLAKDTDTIRSRHGTARSEDSQIHCHLQICHDGEGRNERQRKTAKDSERRADELSDATTFQNAFVLVVKSRYGPDSPFVVRPNGRCGLTHEQTFTAVRTTATVTVFEENYNSRGPAISHVRARPAW
jgi:hypothetical protein